MGCMELAGVREPCRVSLNLKMQLNEEIYNTSVFGKSIRQHCSLCAIIITCSNQDTREIQMTLHMANTSQHKWRKTVYNLVPLRCGLS